MLNDFDLAFLRKVKNVYENTIFADTSLVYNTAYNLVETGELELRFPLVNIYRPLGFKVADEQTLPARRRGWKPSPRCTEQCSGCISGAQRFERAGENLLSSYNVGRDRQG